MTDLRIAISLIVFIIASFALFDSCRADWYESQDFDAYRYEEQRRFEIEQDREDQRDYRERVRESREDWEDIWEEAWED